MAKVSIDVDEIKRSLKATALTAKAQISELAKKAQKDLSRQEVLKRIDQVVEVVKSQEFMKNPKVVEITKKIMTLSEQLEKTVTKSASQIVGQVKATMKPRKPAAKKKAASKKAEGEEAKS